MSAGFVNDVGVNGWLDAMKSSSPTRNRSPQGDDETRYASWMIRYPSALNSLGSIMEQSKEGKLVVFLDYDGTLSPIVDDPDKALLSTQMRTAVMNVARHFPTAIISGRSHDKVYELVDLKELHYAGSHGMDIMFPPSDDASSNGEKEVNLFQPAAEFLPMISEVYRSCVEIGKGVKGAKVENHNFCVSIHYRNVHESSWCLLAQRVHELLKSYPQLRLTHGRKVLEVRPMIDWDKGKAVEFLLESLGGGGFAAGKEEDVIPIYIGDDRTDEDAFMVLRKRKNGYGILVSSTPKESNAFFSLKDTSEVQVFLESLVKMQKREAL